MKLPKSPVKLSKSGQEIYDKVGGYLIKNNLFKEVDVPLLFSLATQWENYVYFTVELRKNGAIQAFPNGTRQVSPEFTGQKGCLEKLYRLFAQLGIGEEARKKLNIIEGEGVTDPSAELGDI